MTLPPWPPPKHGCSPARGPFSDIHVAAVRTYADAGFDHLVPQNADPDGFLDFHRETLADRLRTLG